MANKWRVISAEEAKAHSLYGVGGWLLLLVVGMMVLGPLLGAGRIVADILAVELEYPALASVDEWNTFKSATWSAFLAIAALSFYGGWGLANGEEWLVVKRAKAILWISGPIGSLVMGVAIPLITFGKSNVGEGQFVGGFLASIIAAAIWAAYLSKSKRVRVTFAHSVLAASSDAEDRSEAHARSLQLSQLYSLPTDVASASTDPYQLSKFGAANVEEEFWAKALAEYESGNRRPGVWARVFSEAQGNKPVAKANYLKHRVEELSLDHQRHVRAQEQAEREAIEKARFARLTEEQRAHELLPKGHCPSCEAVIPMSAKVCPKCRALFGTGSAWKVLPIKMSENARAR